MTAHFMAIKAFRGKWYSGEEMESSREWIWIDGRRLSLILTTSYKHTFTGNSFRLMSLFNYRVLFLTVPIPRPPLLAQNQNEKRPTSKPDKNFHVTKSLFFLVLKMGRSGPVKKNPWVFKYKWAFNQFCVFSGRERRPHHRENQHAVPTAHNNETWNTTNFVNCTYLLALRFVLSEHPPAQNNVWLMLTRDSDQPKRPTHLSNLDSKEKEQNKLGGEIITPHSWWI